MRYHAHFPKKFEPIKASIPALEELSYAVCGHEFTLKSHGVEADEVIMAVRRLPTDNALQIHSPNAFEKASWWDGPICGGLINSLLSTGKL